MDLIEWQWRKRSVETELDQCSPLAREIRLCTHPLRLHGIRRPDNDDGLGRAQSLLDHLSIGTMTRQLIVAPHFIAQRTQRFRDQLGRGLRRVSIGDKYL